MSALAERRIDDCYPEHFFDGGVVFMERAKVLVDSDDPSQLGGLLQWQYQHAEDVFCWSSILGTDELTAQGYFFDVDHKRYQRIERPAVNGSLVVVHQTGGEGTFDGRFFLDKKGALTRVEITDGGEGLTVNFIGDGAEVEWSKFK